jgi:hypothetical protein
MASKIKVDNIENQCGGAVVTKCGATTTISGSVVKADDIQAADGGNIINQCGTTITLGASGDTINLASGASQTGFGRTGTVDWDTTAKTASFTAVSGNGYFVNTTSGGVTANLPAGSAGAIVSFSDYTRTFGTNNLTVTPNGSEKIGGVAASIYLNVNGQAITLVYVDATEGWINIQNAEDTEQGIVPSFIAATGGTITCCGDYKIHTFTGPGTFTVCSVGNPAGSTSVDYMVVAGGGGTGSRWHAGGGGAGGYREGFNPGSYTASPLATTALPVSAQSYPITVGGGGSGGPAPGNNPAPNNGSNSIFSSITSTGGGKGGTYDEVGADGGSGGGSGANPSSKAGGSGNTPPVSPPQGNNGGNGEPASGGGAGGGGGGATQAGSPTPSEFVAGDGGDGATTGISGTNTAYAGGGAGSSGDSGTPGTGGTGGGGNSSSNGTTNTGGGGGAPSGSNDNGTSGGSGIVIIRYKFQ